MGEKAPGDSVLHEHPFYGQEIYRQQQQDYIKLLLKKYKDLPVTEDLKKQIWDELQMEKHLGRVTIPFKIATRYDPYGKLAPYIEVILDTKV